MQRSAPIAVVVPVYNRRLKLINTLSTVLAQFRSPALVVVVDDGSSDGSGDVAEAWLKHNAKFDWKVIRQSNAGVASARNAGFAEIGDQPFVSFLDFDDLWPPEFLTEGLRALEGRADVVASVASRVLEIAGQRRPAEHFDAFIADPILWLICRNSGMLSCLTIRSGAALTAGLFVPGMVVAEDRDFLIRLFLQGRAARSDASPVHFIKRAPIEPTEPPNLSSAFYDQPYKLACYLETTLPKLPTSHLEDHGVLIRNVMAHRWALSAFSCRQTHQIRRAAVSLWHALAWDANWLRRVRLIWCLCQDNRQLLTAYKRTLPKTPVNLGVSHSEQLGRTD